MAARSETRGAFAQQTHTVLRRKPKNCRQNREIISPKKWTSPFSYFFFRVRGSSRGWLPCHGSRPKSDSHLQNCQSLVNRVIECSDDAAIFLVLRLEKRWKHVVAGESKRTSLIWLDSLIECLIGRRKVPMVNRSFSANHQEASRGRSLGESWRSAAHTLESDIMCRMTREAE